MDIPRQPDIPPNTERPSIAPPARLLDVPFTRGGRVAKPNVCTDTDPQFIRQAPRRHGKGAQFVVAAAVEIKPEPPKPPELSTATGEKLSPTELTSSLEKPPVEENRDTNDPKLAPEPNPEETAEPDGTVDEAETPEPSDRPIDTIVPFHVAADPQEGRSNPDQTQLEKDNQTPKPVIDSQDSDADGDVPPPSANPPEPPIDPPADHGELRSDEPGDPLPLTVNDIRWESLHGGSIAIVDNPRPGGDVLKIYQRPSAHGVPGPIKLTTPGGTVAFLRGHEIVQVHKRDDQGVVESSPSAVFQGPSLLPDGFEMKFVPRADLSDEHLEDVYNTNMVLMSKITRMFRRNEDSGIRALASGTPHITLVHYPLYGKPMRVITPSGFLLVGYSGDAIEYFVESRTGSMPTGSTTMANLAEDERYIVL